MNEKRGVDVDGNGELQEQLESLKRFKPEQYDVVKKTIEMLHGQIIRPLPDSSVERISTTATHDDEAKVTGKTSPEMEGNKIGSPEITFQCPVCWLPVKTMLKYAGRPMVCPSCNRRIEVPSP